MSIMNRFGEYRHPLEILEKTQVPDGQGGFVEEWDTVKQVWGSVNPISSERKNEYQKTDTEVTHEIEIRGMLDINTNDNKILFKGNRIFELVEAPKDIEERNDKKILVVKEVEGDIR